jgi:polyisoprenoid-binding protein YceI
MGWTARTVAAVLVGMSIGACGASSTAKVAPAASSSPACRTLPSGDRAFRIDQAEVSYTAHEQITKKEIQALLKIAGIDNTAVGRTSQVTGEVDLARDLSIARLQVTANLRTLSSDSPLRDDRIRNEFLESNRYPNAIFSATGVATVSSPYPPGQDAQFDVPGRLTVREITNPFTLRMKGRLTGSTLSGSGSGMLRMKDYSFDPPEIAGAIKVEEGLMVAVTFTANETRCSALPT